MATATIAFDVSIGDKPSGRLAFDLDKCRHAQHLLQLVRAQKFRGSRLLFSPSMLFIILETQGGVTVPESLTHLDQLLKDGRVPLPPTGALFVPPASSLESAKSAPNSHYLISLPSQKHDQPKKENDLSTQQPPNSAPHGQKKPRRPADKDRLQSKSATVAQDTKSSAWTTSSPLQFPNSEAAAFSDSIATVPTGTSMSNPHKLPMKYPIGDLSRIRPELRPKYNSKSFIADLIPSGDRTATTRNPPTGVKVDHFVSFIGVAGVYQVVGFEKVDLGSLEGLERWSQREGWSTEAAFTFGTQVATGRTQMVYKRVDTLPPEEIAVNRTATNTTASLVSALSVIGRLSAGSDLMHLLTQAGAATIDGCGEVIELE